MGFSTVFSDGMGSWSFGRVFSGIVIASGLGHGFYSGSVEWQGIAVLAAAIYGLSKAGDTLAEFAGKK